MEYESGDISTQVRKRNSKLRKGLSNCTFLIMVLWQLAGLAAGLLYIGETCMGYWMV